MSNNEQIIIECKVNSSELKWPTSSIANSEDGEQFSVTFQDMRGFSWPEASKVLELEERLFTQNCNDLKRTEELMTNGDIHRLHFLDVGVASTVLALSATKCYPIASCNGGLSHNNEPYPMVLFRCRLARVPDMLTVARDVNCGMKNGPEGTLIVYGDTVRMLMRFARALIDKRHKLAKIRHLKRRF